VKTKRKKKKEKKKKIRVLLTFHLFGLPGEAVLPNDKKNCFSSQNESAFQIKSQLMLFCLEPELYQTDREREKTMMTCAST
jgi:hypothetical protein